MFRKYGMLGLALGATTMLALQNPAGAPAGANRIDLGRLSNGATVAFVRAGAGDWGIQISGGGAPRFSQPKPAQVEVFRRGDTVSDLASGYQSVQKQGDGVMATAKVTGGEAAFSVEDRWKAVPGLGRQTQRPPQAIRVDRQSRRHPRKGQARPPSARYWLICLPHYA